VVVVSSHSIGSSWRVIARASTSSMRRHGHRDRLGDGRPFRCAAISP
jgi:hypothetical protein